MKDVKGLILALVDEAEATLAEGVYEEDSSRCDPMDAGHAYGLLRAIKLVLQHAGAPECWDCEAGIDTPVPHAWMEDYSLEVDAEDQGTSACTTQCCRPVATEVEPLSPGWEPKTDAEADRYKWCYVHKRSMDDCGCCCNDYPSCTCEKDAPDGEVFNCIVRSEATEVEGVHQGCAVRQHPTDPYAYYCDTHKRTISLLGCKLDCKEDTPCES